MGNIYNLHIHIPFCVCSLSEYRHGKAIFNFLKKVTVKIKYAHIEAANLSLFVKLGCSEYRKNCWMYNYALCLPEVHNIKFFVYI